MRRLEILYFLYAASARAVASSRTCTERMKHDVKKLNVPRMNGTNKVKTRSDKKSDKKRALVYAHKSVQSEAQRKNA